MGELLFVAAALHAAGIDPEQALQKCNAAFFTTGHADNREG